MRSYSEPPAASALALAGLVMASVTLTMGGMGAAIVRASTTASGWITVCGAVCAFFALFGFTLHPVSRQLRRRALKIGFAASTVAVILSAAGLMSGKLVWLFLSWAFTYIAILWLMYGLLLSPTQSKPHQPTTEGGPS